MGRYEDGRLGEVFIDCNKVASPVADDARDIAVLISIALQCGVPFDAMKGAVTRPENGAPAGLAGRFFAALAEHEAASPTA